MLAIGSDSAMTTAVERRKSLLSMDFALLRPRKRIMSPAGKLSQR
jgi:hypothetical protein